MPLLPFLLAVGTLAAAALIAGRREVEPTHGVVQGADVGLMSGAFGAYDAGLYQLAHAAGGPAAAGPVAAGL